MMQSASLPLPEVTELGDMPTEFGMLAQCDARPRSSDIRARRAASAGEASTRLDPIQVWHLDDPRASVFALFA